MTTLALAPISAAVTKPPKLTAQQAGAKPTRLLGLAGPLRIFAETAFHGGKSYESPTRRGWAGPYCCDTCLLACDGVYRVGERWLCGSCKSPRKPPASPEVRERMRRERNARTDKTPGWCGASLASGVGDSIAHPSRTPRSIQERSPCRRKPNTRSV
jgi:hypothetical protein